MLEGMVNSVDLFKRNGTELKWNAFLKEQHFHVHTLAIWSDKGSLFHPHILANQRRYAIVFVQRSQHHIYYLYQVIYREFRYPPTVLHSNLKGKPQILQSATISIFPYSLIGPALSLHLSPLRWQLCCVWWHKFFRAGDGSRGSPSAPLQD